MDKEGINADWPNLRIIFVNVSPILALYYYLFFVRLVLGFLQTVSIFSYCSSLLFLFASIIPVPKKFVITCVLKCLKKIQGAFFLVPYPHICLPTVQIYGWYIFPGFEQCTQSPEWSLHVQCCSLASVLLSTQSSHPNWSPN